MIGEKKKNGGEWANPASATSRRCVCVFVCMKLCEVENISLLVQTPMESAQHSYLAKNKPPKPCTFVSENSSTLSPQLNSVIHNEKDNSHTAAE